METKTMSFRDTIILAMSEEMRRDENVFLMGEDVGVFGGDFGTSVGMLEEFGPERVRDCPISEAAISGAAAGAAMTGLRPIVDMTFMDFSVIAMDNIVNQAAKTRYMFGGKGQVPMTVRCAAGNGVGSAAQHSQSLESWFTHIPGLKVVAPGTPADMKGLLKSSIRDNNPVIILEYKSEFNQKGEVPVDPDYTIPLGVGEIKRQGTDVTVVTYGKMLRRVVQAAEELAEEGISVEIVDPRTLVPLDKDIIINSVKKTGKVEVFANVTESKIQDIKIYGDFFGIEDVAAVEDVLRGVKYEREDVLKALKTIDITRYFAGISREEIAEAVVG